MNSQLQFKLNWERSDGGPPEEQITYASLGIWTDERAITRVEDLIAKTTRDVVRVSAYPLALWLASNWWRLRWEVPTRESREDWSMAHRVAAAGGGYLWPDLEIISHGDFIRLRARDTSNYDAASLSYLNNIDSSFPAGEFVGAVDEFVETVLERLSTQGIPDTPLHEIWSLVRQERRNAEMSRYRRLEALLGYDAEEGPKDRINALLAASSRLGEEAIAEVAADVGQVEALEEVESRLDGADELKIQDFSILRAHIGGHRNHRYPWQRGEEAAKALREAIGHPRGPLDNAFLEQWLTLPEDVLKSPPSEGVAFAAALRDEAEADTARLVFRSNFVSGRRFEVVRLVGDHLVAAPASDRLLPATHAKTARQSIQRAFAAEFLLPLEDLVERLGETPEDEDRVEDLAAEYEVSPVVVRTRLVNKGMSEAIV